MKQHKHEGINRIKNNCYWLNTKSTRESLLPQGKVQPRSSGQQGTVNFWTHRTHQQNQPSPICRQWTNVMLTLFYRLYNVWYNRGPSYTQTIGGHTTVSRKNFIQNMQVNHSVNFVDPETGVHTQTIKSCWARTKLKFKTMKGISADALPSYLDERMWPDHWGKTTEDVFNNLCAHIAEHYPV